MILPRGKILVTTRYGLSIALSDLGTSSDEEKVAVEEQEPVSPIKSEEGAANMAEHIECLEDDKPPQAIVVTAG